MHRTARNAPGGLVYLVSNRGNGPRDLALSGEGRALTSTIERCPSRIFPPMFPRWQTTADEPNASASRRGREFVDRHWLSGQS